jgi:hypothetical protein
MSAGADNLICRPAAGTTLAFIALAFGSPVPAAESVKLPAELHGDWCFHDAVGNTTLYDRGDCRSQEGWIAIDATSYDAKNVRCMMSKISRVARKDVGRPAYMLQYRCRGSEGSTWTDNKTMFLGRDDGLVVEQK